LSHAGARRGDDRRHLLDVYAELARITAHLCAGTLQFEIRIHPDTQARHQLCFGGDNRDAVHLG